MQFQSILHFWFQEQVAKQYAAKYAALEALRSWRLYSILVTLCLLSLNAFAQGAPEAKPAESTHRVLLLGGVNLIQDSDQPKIRALYQTVGLYIARSLLDNLKANGLAVEAYIPDQRMPKAEFEPNVALAILKCKCTMLLQTTLRAQNGSLQFKFEAMTLKVERTGITPQEKWQLKKEFPATEEGLAAAIPSDIVNEVVAEIWNKKVFSKGADTPAPSMPTQEPKLITRALWDGRLSYNAYCSACHTAGLAGSPRIGDMVAWTPRIALGYAAMLRSTIKGKGVMGPQGGGYLSAVELERAVVYLANQSGGNFAEPEVPAGHPGTHTYTEYPPRPPAPKPPAYETLTPD